MGIMVNGSTFMVLAMLVSLAGIFFTARGALGRPAAAVYSRQMYYITTILVVIVSALFMTLLVTRDYQNAYVHNNVSNDLPMLYVIAAFWAGNQGSFLLWLLILNLMGLFVIASKDENESIILSVVMVTQVFFLIILLADSPFRMIWDVYKDVQPGFKPEDGLGMNALLIDPWMVSHPPVLFLGYASAAIPFGYALAALIRRDSSIMTKKAYPWILFSMISLGVGIFMGGYWAYKVLGWGGYWGWDPVENSSLIPWIISIALLHGLVLERKKGMFVRSNIGLALMYFILVFYSTFLTRSGILSNFSVHSFADYGLSPYLISFLLFYIVSAAALFIKNSGKIETLKLPDNIFAWESLAGYGILVLAGFAAVVLAGTSMPIVSGAVFNKPSSVTEHFYNNVSVPFGMLVLVFMVGSTMSMTGMNFRSRAVVVTAAVSAAAGVAFNLSYTVNPVPYAVTVLSFFVIIMCIYDLITKRTTVVLQSRLTHIGMAVLMIGIMASGYHSSTTNKTFYINKEEKAFSYTIVFKGMTGQGKTSLHFTLEDGGTVRDIYASYYPDPKTGSWFRAPYVIHGFFRDVYLSPVSYHSGIQEASSLLLARDETGTIGDLSVQFKGFRTENMTSPSPQIIADLVINGRPVSPSLKMMEGNRVSVDSQIPGTDRSVSIADMDVGEHKVMLSFTLGRNAVVPPDRAVAEISLKRFIWLVWLGTVIISAGSIIALVRSIRRSPA